MDTHATTPSPKKENVASALEEPHMYPDVV